MQADGRLETGTLFANDFRVVRFLASGGMGSVYVVEQISTGKTRALKVLHADLAQDPTKLERFLQEARAAAKIESDHVVETLSAGFDESVGRAWLAMELLKGQNLAEYVKNQGRRPPGEVLELFRQLCHGVGAAHGVGIVHRDLKPENILLCPGRRGDAAFTVKVLDFGIAATVSDKSAAASGAGVAGSPHWMAPEQTQPDAQILPSTDVWALGLLAFFLLTGRQYWTQANNPNGSIAAVLNEMLFEPLEPASVRAKRYGLEALIPPGFDRWFRLCVHRQQDDRYINANLAFEVLERVLKQVTQQQAAAAEALASVTIPPGLALPPSPDAPPGEFAPPPQEGKGEVLPGAKKKRSAAGIVWILLLACAGGVAYLEQEKTLAYARYVHNMVNPFGYAVLDLRSADTDGVVRDAGTRAANTPEITPLVRDAGAVRDVHSVQSIQYDGTVAPRLIPIPPARNRRRR